MLVCYKCYENLGLDPKQWEHIACDTSIRKECEKCELQGIYVRDVREEIVNA